MSHWRSGMNKPWLKEYPEGVSAEIDLGAYHSVVDLFETSCQAYASRPAYLNMGVSMTYQALDQYSKHFAAYLQTELQLSKGDRLAIYDAKRIAISGGFIWSDASWYYDCKC